MTATMGIGRRSRRLLGGRLLGGAVLGVAAAAVVGVIGGVGEVSAAQVHDSADRVWVAFTPAETRQIAASGVDAIFDHPQVRGQWYAEPDSDTRYRIFYVPGRGYVIAANAQKLVDEAAVHPGGRVYVSINKHSHRPLSLWTRW